MSEDYSKCPECGSETEYDYEPSLQEYPGAYIWPERHYWACPKCGWDHGEDGGRINGQENTRGW
jgi:rubredoxin